MISVSYIAWSDTLAVRNVLSCACVLAISLGCNHTNEASMNDKKAVPHGVEEFADKTGEDVSWNSPRLAAIEETLQQRRARMERETIAQSF